MDNFSECYTEILDQIEQTPAIQLILSLRDIPSPVILFGCGSGICSIVDLCRYYHISITGFADSVKRGCFSDTNFNILSPNELSNTYPDATILICSPLYEQEIYSQLCHLGFSEDSIHRYPFSHPHVLAQDTFEGQYLAGYKWSYNLFTEESSKQIILDRICALLFDKQLYRTSKKPQYFEFELCEKEVFVQAGCFDGATVREFIEYHKRDQQDEIYTFEANLPACEVAQKNLKSYKNVHVIPNGLWSSDTSLPFHSDSSLPSALSFFTNTDDSILVPVTQLDTFFVDKPHPTFIQLDIEGAELEALKGAEHMIRNYKPKLAICVYHKLEDIYEIPQLIHQYNPNYKFWLQRCEDGMYEMVLYAE